MNRKEKKEKRIAHEKLKRLFTREDSKPTRELSLHDRLWEKRNMHSNSHKMVMGIYQFMLHEED